MGIVTFIIVRLPFLNACGSGEDRLQKTITIGFGSGPGSSMDLMPRQLAISMGKHIKKSVVVINKTDGDATINDAYVKAQPADGY